MEALRLRIEMLREQLDSRLMSREDIPRNQKLSEELDDLIAEYQLLMVNQ